MISRPLTLPQTQKEARDLYIEITSNPPHPFDLGQTCAMAPWETASSIGSEIWGLCIVQFVETSH